MLKVRSSPPHLLEVVDGYPALGKNSSVVLHATDHKLAYWLPMSRTMPICGRRLGMWMIILLISFHAALSSSHRSIRQPYWYLSTLATSNQRRASIADAETRNGHIGCSVNLSEQRRGASNLVLVSVQAQNSMIAPPKLTSA